jgi:hypothetical protein
MAESEAAVNPADLIDLTGTLRQLAALPVFADCPQSVRRGVKLDVVRSFTHWGVGGTAYMRERRIRIRIPHFAHAAEMLEVLLHELTHLALPNSEHHGERFRRTLARAAREAWGIEVEPNPPAGVWEIDTLDRPLDPPRRKISAYVLDSNIQAALKPLVESGTVTFPFPKPKPTRAESSSALVEKRAAHAAKMLARAERRLKLARTVSAKWKAKVRYYERAAAKRGRV